MLESNTVHHGDCLALLPEIENETVDAVITDPPYGIDYQSARRTATERHPKIENDKHPFIWWLHDAFRILKANGILLCFCRWDVQEAFKQAIEWAGFTIRSQVIWDREIHGMGDLKASFAPQHDVIWFATKGSYEFPSNRPQSIIRVPRLQGDELRHPNEKPVDLMRYLIQVTTQVGDLIVEPFAGSGSTCLAAMQEGRRCIGMEKDEKYVRLANSRLSSIQITFQLHWHGGIAE